MKMVLERQGEPRFPQPPSFMEELVMGGLVMGGLVMGALVMGILVMVERAKLDLIICHSIITY